MLTIKQIMMFLLVAVTFTACKKETEVNPKPTPTGSLADKLAGSYTLSSFRYSDAQTDVDLPTLPLTNNGQTVSGTVALSRVTDTSVTMKLTLKVTGADDSVQTFSNLEIKQEGSEYGLYAEGVRIADAEGTTVIFNLSQTDPTTKEKINMAFIAKR